MTTKNQAYEYLYCAKKDLTLAGAAKTLGDNANEIYHLQQAVEKAGKSMAMLTGTPLSSLGGKNGHRVQKLTGLMNEKLTEQFKTYNESGVPITNNRPDRTKEILNPISNTIIENSKLNRINSIYSSSSSMVRTLLKENNLPDETENKKIISLNSNEIDHIFLIINGAFGTAVDHVLIVYGFELKDFRSITATSLNENGELRIALSKIYIQYYMCIQYFLHYLLGPHEAFTRYPNDEDEDFYPSRYNENNYNIAIVDRANEVFPSLSNYVNEMIQFFELCFNEKAVVY